MTHRYLLLIFLLTLLNLNVFSQDVPVTPQAALEFFRQGNYEKAGEMYAELLARYPKSSKFNYYIGICELKSNRSVSSAVKHLKYAAAHGVSKDVYYYLGRAYQLDYKFSEAIDAFEKFLKYAKPEDVRYEKAEKYRKESKAGLEKSTKIYYLQVIRKDTIGKNSFLSLYHPVKDAGYIIPNRDFFESGVDPNGILYLTERKDEVYFSMPEDSTGQTDLYKMEKLIDGWSDPMNLKEINSEFNEAYPYLNIDGVTLYFSSDREGGLGGYDIYKTVFDPDTKAFSEPVNLGIPFNSPKDDYFLVTDEFTGVAWFTSNRNTTGDTVMVYEIIWDKSVVKNMVYEENDVKIAASMPLLKNIPEKYKSINEKQGRKKSVSGKKDLFHFEITKDIVYTGFDMFHSKEALEIFKKGYELQQKKDSLSGLMALKRKKYATAKTPGERERLVNEILALEKQVYSLDSDINDYYFRAKNIEKPIVEKLVREGKYKPHNTTNEAKTKKPAEEEILIPKEYSYYTDEEFEKHLKKLDNMYKKLFPPEVAAELRKADSLYVWGNILSLESSKLLERANKQTGNEELVISSVFGKDSGNSKTEEDKSVELSRRGKELKTTALKLYHKALDKKYEIFSSKIKQVILSHPTEDFTFLEERQAQANAYFRRAVEDMNKSATMNPELYERDGSLKRKAVGYQEEGLFLYLDYLNGNTSVLDSVKTTKKKELETKTIVQKVDKTKVTENNNISHVETPARKTGNLEYRIQIGVFRKEPDKQLLNRLPSVSKLPMPNRELTRYMCGHYKTLDEARKYLPEVRKTGLKDAYIIGFYNGRVISVKEALKIQNSN
ncbi:MAG: hypothetical protein GXO47_08540 [Chlorobi bacterium]|nr:hypothetical protein [Chlorobiota bacterium]